MIYLDCTTRMPQRRKVEAFIFEVLQHYLKDTPERDADVSIRMPDKIIDKQAREEGNPFWEHSGECSGDRDEVTITLAKKFWSEIYQKWIPYDMDTLMRNLAHELVHCKQLILGEMNSTNYKWKGVDYSHVAEDYMDQPWEIEAYEAEDMLVERYFYKKS